MSEEKKEKVLSTKVTGELAEKVEKICEGMNATPSEFIRTLIEEGVKKAEESMEGDWSVIEGARRFSECFYAEEDFCRKHSYNKGEFPEALWREAKEKGCSIFEQRREWTEGLFPFMVNRKAVLEVLKPSPKFCRDCRLWRPKESS